MILLSAASHPFVTSFVVGSSRNDINAWVGFQFQVGSRNLVLTALGRYVLPGAANYTHTLSLTDSGAVTTLASVSLDTTTATRGAFAYVGCTPYTLVAGTTYNILSQETLNGDIFYQDTTTPLTTTADATVLYSSYIYSGAFHTNTAGAYSYGPVNFLYH